jgi:O-antigen/teichoic acid export membrane protein
MSGPRAEPTSEAAEPARGVALTLAAKALFIVSGLSIQLLVPRALGTAAYGELAAAAAALAIVTNTLTTTLVQTTSRLVSTAAPAVRAGVERGAVRLAAILGVALGGGFSLLAWPMAHVLLGDLRLAPLLALGGVVIAAYALYAASIGILNGRRTFLAQARLDATFSTIRALGQIGGAMLGLGALGVMGGFSAAAVLLALLGLWRSRSDGAAPSDLSKRFFATLLPLAVLQLALNAVLQLDVEVLKAELVRALLAAGESVSDAAVRSSTVVGTYRAAQQLAFLPYQLSIAVTLVLFPVVAHARQGADDGGARRAIEGALRFTLLLLGLMEAPLVAGGAGAMRLVLPAAYAEGADALPVLAAGQVAFALFALSASALAGAGAMREATRSALAGLVAMLGALVGLVASVGPEGPVRVAAAAGSALGALVALALALFALRRTLEVRFPWWSALRIGASGLAAVLAARLVPGEAPGPGLARLGLALGVMLALLAASRELGPSELALVRRVLARTRPG